MKNETKMYRQGDVLLVAVTAIAASAVMQKPQGQVVLALGEATGHAHLMDGATVREYRTDKPVAVPGVRDWQAERFLRVQMETALRHEKAGQPTGEHDTLHVAPGDYALIPQSEWSDEHEPRRVED